MIITGGGFLSGLINTNALTPKPEKLLEEVSDVFRVSTILIKPRNPRFNGSFAVSYFTTSGTQGMGGEVIKAFRTPLAMKRQVAAETQYQAFR